MTKQREYRTQKLQDVESGIASCSIYDCVEELKVVTRLLWHLVQVNLPLKVPDSCSVCIHIFPR